MNALPPLIVEHMDEVRALCVKYRVKRLTLFGSAVKGTFDQERSDLDFVVEFLPDTPLGGFRGPYFSLLRELEALFARKIDLLEVTTIENPYIAHAIRRNQLHVYEAA